MEVVADDSGFSKQLENIADKAGTKLTNAFTKTAKIIGEVFAVGKIIKFGSEAVQTATAMQSAWTGLNSIVQGTGNSFAAAQDFITEYTKDGLVSVEEAVKSYKNLLSRGYDTTQIENTMIALKDSASFGRQASYGLGEAVATATEGLKNENSILVDNAGVTKNVAKMWQEWAAAHNTTTSAMTQAQKIEAEYNGILKETKFQMGDAATYTKTLGGQFQMLKMSFTNLKTAIGQVVGPILQLLIPVINTAINALTKFFTAIKSILKVFGLEFPDVVSKGASSVVDLGNSAVDTASDIASTGSAANKAAKQIKKAFGSVDEINVLNTKQDSTSGSAGSSGVDTGATSGIDMSGISTVNSTLTETTGVFDVLINKFKNLAKLFSEGLKLGYDKTSFDGIKKSLSGIKKSITSIFDSKDLKSVISNWSNTFTFNLGLIVGSVAKIGVNIMDGLLGSMDNYLSQNSERIKGFFKTIFEINTEELNLYGKLYEALGTISEVFTSDVATQIGADFIAMFTNPIMSLSEVFLGFKTDVEELFFTPIIDNVDKVKQTFNNILSPIQTVTGTLADAFTHVGDTIKKVYDEHIKPFFDDLKTGLSDTFSKFLDVYNEYIQPFVEKTAQRIKDLWDNHLKKLWDNIAGFFGSVIDFIKMLWNQFLKPVIDWIIQNIVPKIVPILDRIGQKVHLVISTIVDIISGLIRTIKGVLDFITGVFTGDWEKAWNGVKDIFGGIWEAIKTLFKMPINWIIDGINLFIKGLNKLEIPDWVPVVGGKGFHIDPIQRLANGGYAERNNPQLAIIGDNTREGEIVSPESKIYEQVLKAIRDTGGASGKQELEMTIYHKYEDGRTIIQKVNQAQIDAGEILLLT